MNFSESRVVTHGPNAGMPRHHIDVLQDKAALTRRAFAVLKRNGFLVLSALLNVGDAPNIKVLPNASTRRLIDEEIATKYGSGPDRAYWQAWLEGVRIVWTERVRT